METKHQIKKQNLIAFILNAAIVMMEIIGLIMSFSRHGMKSFQFYTEDSNMFALVSSLLFCAWTVTNGKKESALLPKWIHVMKYMSNCCLAVTFIVVITVLAPMAGPKGYQMMMLSNSMLFHHFLCPVISLISFIFFEKEPKIDVKHSFYALMPTIVYALIVTLLNILRVMEGPYPFFHVYEQPLFATVLWFIGIIDGAYLIARFVRFLNLKNTWRIRFDTSNR